MDKDIKLGTVGDVDFNFTAGKGKITLTIPGADGVAAGAFVTADSEAMVNALFVAIEKALPPSALPIEESVKMIIISALKSIV